MRVELRRNVGDYLNNVLIPTLRIGDIIVMDNMSSHHANEVSKTMAESDKHRTLLYLPLYSMNFNLLKMIWSKIKAILRKMRIRYVKGLLSVIKNAFLCISALDCMRWFSAGYNRY